MRVLVEVGAMQKVPTHAVNMLRVQRDLTIKRKNILAAMKAGRYDRLHPDDIPDPYLLEWREDREHVYLPRRYPVPFLKGYEGEYVDLRPKHKPIPFKARMTLRPKQLEASQAMVRNGELQEIIVTLAPGRGKTVLLLWALCQIKTGPVLVIVPDTGIAKQWIDRINHPTKGIDCPGGIGIVGDGKFDFQGRGIIIGVLDTVSRNDLPQAFYEHFDTVAIDEGHSTCTKVRRQIYYHYTGRRIVLDATPHRTDGTGKLLGLHVGPIGIEDLEPEVRATCFFLETGSYVNDPARWKMKKNDPRYRPSLYDWPKVDSALSENAERNKVIIETVVAAWHKGRTMLVLGTVKNHLRILGQLFEKATGEEAAVLTGEIKMKDRASTLENYRVVFAVKQLARRALDKESLDTIFFVSPFKDKNMLQQAIGRTERLYDDKKDPMAVIFEDRQQPTAAMMTDAIRSNLRRLGYVYNERKFKAAA